MSIQLSNVPVGSIVLIPIQDNSYSDDYSNHPFIVAQHGKPWTETWCEYGDSFNNVTLLLDFSSIYSDDAPTMFAWNEPIYEGSDIDTYLTTTYYNKLHPQVRAQLKTVAIPHYGWINPFVTTDGYQLLSGATGLQRQIFIPSAAELGFDIEPYYSVDGPGFYLEGMSEGGVSFEIFTGKPTLDSVDNGYGRNYSYHRNTHTGYFDDQLGSEPYYTRTPVANETDFVYVYDSEYGDISSGEDLLKSTQANTSNSSIHIRPIIAMSSTTAFEQMSETVTNALNMFGQYPDVDAKPYLFVLESGESSESNSFGHVYVNGAWRNLK